MTEHPIDSDPDLMISVYRDVMNDYSRARSPDLRRDYEAIIAQLRAIWQSSQGSDSLHEAAFGQLSEVCGSTLTAPAEAPLHRKLN